MLTNVKPRRRGLSVLQSAARISKNAIITMVALFIVLTILFYSRNHDFTGSEVLLQQRSRVSGLTGPVSVAELGTGSWALLHSIVSMLPEPAGPEHRVLFETFITSFATLYPCRDCGEHFQGLLTKYPVPDETVFSKARLSQWLCSIHNHVNERTGKQIYDCSTVDEEWYGLSDVDCGCNGDE